MLPDPGDRQPAPEPMRLVQAFVNTVDIENGVEELADSAALRDVLIRIGALSRGATTLDDGDLGRALELREALRRLLLVNAGGEVDAEALTALERASAAARLSIRFERDATPTLHPQAGGLDGALGRILAVVFTAMADGSWARLKACPRDVCGWVFYDRSRNLSSRWCSMSVCGNRTKIKRYRGKAARAA
ncbi:MAG TPA: CGNR zinc finger domain-containing protein [Gaiellaceae bacterium]